MSTATATTCLEKIEAILREVGDPATKIARVTAEGNAFLADLEDERSFHEEEAVARRARHRDSGDVNSIPSPLRICHGTDLGHRAEQLRAHGICFEGD